MLAYSSPDARSTGQPATHPHGVETEDIGVYLNKEDPISSINAFVSVAEGEYQPQPTGCCGSLCIVELKKTFGRIIPNGGFLSGVFNLAGSSLGAGILALPSAMNTSGIIMGTIYLLAIYALTVYSLRILAMAAKKTRIRSYEGMARGLFGRGGDIFTAIIMFVKCFGACIAYVICVSDLWSAFLKDESVHGYYRTKSFNRVLTSVTFVTLMLPLSLPKQINSLRYVSLIGVSFILFFVICVIIHSCTHGLKDIGDQGLVLVATGNGAIRGLGMFMFAYLCQSNMFEVWNEMKPEPTVFRMQNETLFGMLICTILYWLTGFFGYADFGSAVQSSLLTVYSPLKDYYFAVAYIGIVVKLCVAFALHILPCRDAVHHLVGWHLNTIPWWKNAVLCTILSLLSLLAGLFIPNVNMVFGLLGSSTGGFIAFVFPSLFLIYCGDFELRKIGWLDYFGTLVLLACGVIVICFGTTSTIFVEATKNA